MGGKLMASVAGSAVLFYVVLSGRLCPATDNEDHGELSGTRAGAMALAEEARRRREEEKERKMLEKMKKALAKWPDRAPANWCEATTVSAKTLRFMYSETLGKWPLGDIAFGIKYYMKQQGDLQHELAGSSSRLLNGPEIREELIRLLRYLNLCMFFSKKPYEVFLEFGGFCQDNVLIRKSKAKVLKPAFTIVRDGSTKCFLLLIRGAISVKERLTAAAGLEVPFHHVTRQDGRAANVVLGYAHCGMLAAARWIANQAVPVLTTALNQFPDYKVKIIGHSMGAGIASILTYLLRENERLSSASCIAYAPAACMTWELAEASKEFVTTLVNKTDVVPSFSKVSVASLRTKVMASSWANDLREQIKQTRFLNFVNRSVSFMRSHVPFVSNPRSKVVDVDMLSKPTVKDNMKQSLDQQHTKRPVLSYLCCNPAQPRTDPMDSFVPDDANGKIVDADDPEIGQGETSAAAGVETDEIEESAAGPSQGSSGRSQASLQFYPPGRIMHMLVLPSQDPNQGENSGTAGSRGEEEFVGIYETPRELYGKIRLARTMVREHYMPRYIRTMELLIDKLGAGEEEDRDGEP